jgi:hypothetical protein
VLLNELAMPPIFRLALRACGEGEPEVPAT